MAATVRLKNGAEEVKTLVAIVMGSLEDIAEEQPFALCDLVMKCRDRNHRFFGDNEKHLQALKLVEADGSIHDSSRNVILSAVRGDGLDMVLGSPLAEEELCP